MFKQRRGFRVGRRGLRLWQDGYYEHVVRDERLIPNITAYILNNPVRAGLAASVQEYAYCRVAAIQHQRAGRRRPVAAATVDVARPFQRRERERTVAALKGPRHKIKGSRDTSRHSVT